MIFNALANGMGGLDWSGLPFFVELYDVVNVDSLIHRLTVIKNHKPETGQDQ